MGQPLPSTAFRPTSHVGLWAPPTSSGLARQPQIRFVRQHGRGDGQEEACCRISRNFLAGSWRMRKRVAGGRVSASGHWLAGRFPGIWPDRRGHGLRDRTRFRMRALDLSIT